MVKSCILTALLLGWMTALPAQNRISFNFNDDSQQWSVVRGKVVLEAEGAYEGKAMKMSPDAIVRFDLPLRQSSVYRITAWMRTESGADDMTLQLEGLGKITSAFRQRWLRGPNTNVLSTFRKDKRKGSWRLLSAVRREIRRHGSIRLKWNVLVPTKRRK